jgi:hypothetical protein
MGEDMTDGIGWFEAIIAGVLFFMLWVFMVFANHLVRNDLQKDLLARKPLKLLFLKSIGCGWIFGFGVFFLTGVISGGEIEASDLVWFGISFFTLGLCVYLWNFARLSRLEYSELLLLGSSEALEQYRAVNQHKTDK